MPASHRVPFSACAGHFSTQAPHPPHRDFRACVEHCPAQALKGTLWEAGMTRKEIVDAEACYQKQLEIMYERTGIRTDLCGKCFAVCTYTQKYLQSVSKE